MVAKYKLFSFLVFLVTFFTLNVSSILANEPTMYLFPDTGKVEAGKDFMLDVMIDTKGEEVVLARAVLKFNPELVQVKSVEENSDIFCDWPAEGQLIDNEEGLIMVTGFCQSGFDEIYATVEEADVLARLTFTTIKEGNLTVSWEYTGIDEPFQSVLIQDGSPPQNIFLLDEASMSYDYVITAPEKPVEPRMPETSVPIFENISSTFLFGGGIFVLAFVANILLDPKRRYFSKSRTIVIYDDGKK